MSKQGDGGNKNGQGPKKPGTPGQAGPGTVYINVDKRGEAYRKLMEEAEKEKSQPSTSQVQTQATQKPVVTKKPFLQRKDTEFVKIPANPDTLPLKRNPNEPKRYPLSAKQVFEQAQKPAELTRQQNVNILKPINAQENQNPQKPLESREPGKYDVVRGQRKTSNNPSVQSVFPNTQQVKPQVAQTRKTPEEIAGVEPSLRGKNTLAVAKPMPARSAPGVPGVEPNFIAPIGDKGTIYQRRLPRRDAKFETPPPPPTTPYPYEGKKIPVLPNNEPKTAVTRDPNRNLTIRPGEPVGMPPMPKSRLAPQQHASSPTQQAKPAVTTQQPGNKDTKVFSPEEIKKALTSPKNQATQPKSAPQPQQTPRQYAGKVGVAAAGPGPGPLTQKQRDEFQKPNLPRFPKTSEPMQKPAPTKQTYNIPKDLSPESIRKWQDEQTAAPNPKAPRNYNDYTRYQQVPGRFGIEAPSKGGGPNVPIPKGNKPPAPPGKDDFKAKSTQQGENVRNANLGSLQPSPGGSRPQGVPSINK